MYIATIARHAPQAPKDLFRGTHRGLPPVDRPCLAGGYHLHAVPGRVGFASPTNQAMHSLILAPRFPEGDHRSVTSSVAQGCPVSCIAGMRLAPVDKTGDQSLAANPVLPQAPDTHESDGF